MNDKMAAASSLLYLLVNFLLIRVSFAANAAFDKVVIAEPSCGVNKTEMYFHISQAKILPFLRNISRCNQDQPEFAHPPNYMVDENYMTFWQAEGGKDKATITVDLSGLNQKFYYVKSITISFGDYYRPDHISFRKKSSSSSNFEPWHYLVTEIDECETVFGVPYKTIPSRANAILCTSYDQTLLERNENVTIRFQGGRGTIVNPRTRNGNEEPELNTQLLDWMNTTEVELKFSGLRLFPDRLASEWQHYVVKEVKVEAYCHCNGHADGINCPYNQTTKTRDCVCQDGTCGVRCGYCCPAYNQYPYQIGKLGPFATDKNAACEKCNCYGHSDVCVYNDTVAKNDCTDYSNNATNDQCSMDIFGKYRGGGVCQNCRDNTEGINCQRCVTKYYREEGRSHWEKDACQPCNCFQNGTMYTTRNGVGYLDCVRDDEEAAKLEDLAPGDCLCKNKTTGRRCNRCVDGYYNLTAENPEGCLACMCITSGTVNASINCDDDGLCSCKERVIGDKCSQCQNGTFNLNNDNQYGCTVCMCSGVTQNCSSSSLYISKTKYLLEGWSLTRGFDLDDVMTVMNIQEDMDGQPVDMISANVSSGQLLYWTTNKDYFKGTSLATSYGGYLEFARKVSFVQNGILQTVRRIVIKGPRNITIETLLPPLNVTLQSPEKESVKMVEFGWKHHHTNSTVDRRTFMLILSKPERMWITASCFTAGNGTYQTSFGNLLISSVSNKSNGSGVAVDVEQCTCGEAYQGSSCERCARGYHRINVTGHPFFGQCVVCECNSHTEDCDADTGKCLDCQHNTTGFNCQQCSDGYYGNARNGAEDDCQKCPCEPPKTTTDLCVMLSNGSAQCLNCSKGYEKNLQCNRCELGYFGRPFLKGGNCSLCQCNSNSDICDRESGSCLAYCENNSTGLHCERCENGTYGNAVKQQCRACTCDSTGSYDVPCDFKTGHCHCKPNVKGFNCSECEENSYGFNHTGCKQCGCNEFGSANLQCNNSGICLCKNHTHGEKCDACVDFYYGLPNATCQDCACNVTGSNGTICDHVIGQCSCKSGVEGRRCDRCKIQHKDFSDAGCEPCPACSMKLQSIVDDASSLLRTAKYEADQANKSIDYYMVLETVEGKIPAVKRLQEQHANVIERLEEYRKTLTNTSLNATILSLEKREADLMNEAQVLSGNLSVEIERVENISRKARSSNDYANDVKSKTQKIVNELLSHSSRSEAMNMFSSIAVDSLRGSISEATLQTKHGSNLTVTVSQLPSKTGQANVMVNNQKTDIERLLTMVEEFDSALNRTTMQIEQNKSWMNLAYRDIETVKNSSDQVNFTIHNIDSILKQTALYINDSDISISDGEANYKNVRETKLPELNQELETLKSDINNVNASYLVAKTLVDSARQRADNLTAEAEQLARIFDEARLHGEKAVESIRRYKEITKKVQRSVNMSMEANKAVNELFNRIQNLTVASQSVNAKATECKNASVSLLAATRARNVAIAELNTTVSEVNKVFHAAIETCNKVETYASIFETRRTVIINTTAGERPLIMNDIQHATDYVSNMRNISDDIELETIEQKKRLLTANVTLGEINTLVVNSSQVLENTHITGNETEKLLANISQSVNQTEQIKQENEQTEQFLMSKIAALQAKLTAAKEKVAKFRLAMNIRGNTSVQYRPTQRMISNPVLNMISLDFKTNRSSGLLLYMSPSANNTHQSVSLKLVVNRVRFTYNIASSPVVVTNWEVSVLENVWYRIYATRYQDNARLTVTNLASGFSRTYEGPKRIIPNTEMSFNVNSSVFLGGLPSSENANVIDRYFDGNLDNLVLNEDRVPLFKPLAVEGVRRFAVKRVPRNIYEVCDTFHGNGFIKQRAGDFQTRTNSSLEFQFRTFFKNAVIVLVEGRNKEFIYSVSLSNGRVIFHYNNTRLASNNSDYNDGQWYHVAVTRTLKNASLHITALESSKGSDHVKASRRLALYLPQAEFVYFGGTNDTRERFAGDMKLVSLNSMVQNRLVRRNLTDDKNMTVSSSGVVKDQCLRTVERGLRYSSGYSSLNTENITSLSSLTMRFKTNEPSGLLAYSVKENLRFYLSLFHGNVFLVYSNGSRNQLTLQTQTETLNDGAYHTVEVEIQNSRIQMSVDKATPGESVSDVLRGMLAPLPLENFYTAGIPSFITIPLQIPVLGSFIGDINLVQINGDVIFDGSSPRVFTFAASVGVSAAGVSPASVVLPTPLPTNTPSPPTCGAKYPQKVLSEKQDEVHFQGVDSVLTLNVNRSLINEMALSFVITIEFRSLSPNGVLFLAADNQTSQFVALELVDGNLVYQFNTGSGLVRMRTSGTYTVGGAWYKVDLLRIKDFGAMVVRQTKEYHKNSTVENTDRLNINNVFVGGVVRGAVDTSVIENPKAPSFFGCIREISIQTEFTTQEFNLSGDSIPDGTRNIQPGQCFDYVQPQVGFDGSGFAKLDGTYDLSADSELSIRFRTTKRNGLLFFATNQNGTNRMVIEEVNGQIFLSYINNNSPIVLLQWVDPVITSPLMVNTSYALCDNIYHTVTVKRSSGRVEMDVDGRSTVRSNITDAELSATVYVGGIPSGLHVNVGVTGQRFVGCIESVFINQQVVDFKHGTAEQEFIEYGCRAKIKPQDSYQDLNMFKVMFVK